MDPIDLLEQRIAALELQVLPQNSQTPPTKRLTNVAELLIQAHTMTSTALSCREIISSILKKLSFINGYLDPLYCENQLELEGKRRYVLEMYPELKDTAALLKEFDDLEPVLNCENINVVPNVATKIERMAAAVADVHDENAVTTRQILECLYKYIEISKTVQVLFAQLERSVAELEQVLYPKVQMDE